MGIVPRPALLSVFARAFPILGVLAVGSPRQGLPQIVSGQIVDSLSGAGIAGGYVVLLDSTGRELARTLSDTRGGFELRAPGPGTFRLGARRIGFRPAVSAPVTLGATALTGYRLTVGSIPVTLGAVVVEGKPRCGGSTDDGSDLAAVWGQAREALAAVSWTAKAPYLYRLSLFERALDEFGRSVLRERTSSRTGYYRTPFESAPPEDLVRDGYVVGTQLNRVYFGPDAAVLLSDAFVSSHCFSLARDPKDPRLVGLAFKPAPGRHVSEVQGTLWVDRRTAELRSFSYSYVNLPSDLPENVAGGEAGFLRLPSGAWIIARWSIRNPIMRRSYTFGGAPVYSLAAVQETGGQVLEVTNARRDRVYLADAALLEGTVFDSVANAPLAGATVKLLGTDLSATTDDSGRFQLEASLEGEYRVTFEHPGLDSLGFTPTPVSVSLAKGHPAELRLSTVGETGIMARLCPGSRSSEGQGIVLGTVRDDSRPLGGIRLSATWFDAGVKGNSLAAAGRGLELVTDSTGDYLLCGVPVNARMVLRLEAAHGVRVETVGLGSHRIAVGGKEYVTRARAIWWHDVLAGPGSAPATVVATVTDTLGQAVANAVVTLLGTQAVGVTDRRGRVALAGVPPGSNLLAVRRLGYRPLDRVVDVPPADTLTLARGILALAPLPVVLDTAVVTGALEERMLKVSGFYDRRKEGFGDFITRFEFEKNAPASVYDILRRLAAVSVRPNAARYNDPRNGPMWLLLSRRIGWRGSPGANVNALQACAMQVYLNGTRLGDGFTVELDDVLNLNDIEAVEAYDGGADVPPEFNATGSECGVIAIWTKR